MTRARVVAEAAAIVDEQGIEALSMRALADRLGVSAMTPYRYVAGKEELLAALADHYMGEVRLPEPGDGPWDARIRAVFRSVRQVLLEHPALASIVAVRRLNGPASYRGAEVVLAALDEAGLEPGVGVGVFASLSAFTVGFVQQELPTPQREQQLDDRVVAVHHLPPDQFPHITGSAEAFLRRDSEGHFETGLTLLIDGIKELSA